MSGVRPDLLSNDRGRRAFWLTTAIVGAAALLRFWSLRYGIPFAPGVDEPQIVDRAVRILKTGDFNPHFFDYPSLYIYLQTLVAIPRFIWGALHGEWTTLAAAPASAFYLWARVLTASLGTATVYLVYQCGRRWDGATALLGAALMAVMPLHVRESHFALTDVPATFFMTLTWYLTMVAQERPALRRFVLAGVAAGLATGTKYNAVFALMMPVVACAATRPLSRRTLRDVAAVLITAGLTFLVTTPYAIFDLPGFLDAFARLAGAYQNTVATPPAITYAKHLRLAFGWTGSAAVLAGLLVAAAHAVRGPDRVKWSLPVVVPMVYYAFISRQHIVFARYLLPAIPFLAILAAIAVVSVWRLLGRVTSRRAAILAVSAAIAAAIILPGAVSAIQFDREIGRTWTSELAYRWVLANVPRGTRIVIESRVLLLPDRYRVANVPQLRLKRLEDYRAEGVGYLVASSQCYGPYFAAPEKDPPACEDYRRIFAGTETVAQFTPSKSHPGAELRILKVPQ